MPSRGTTVTSRGAQVAVGALLVYLSIAVLLSADAWGSPATRWIGSCCDPEQTIWFIRWLPYAIEHGLNPFVTYQLNAPLGANLMWNSSIPLIGLVLAPLTLTAGPIVAYNVAIVASIALSAWCCFLALRRFAAGPIAPFAGGAVYGFSPYVMSHAALHLNLTAVWAPPLFVLLLDKLLADRAGSPRILGVAVGLVAAGQLLTSEEVLATSAVSAAVLVGVIAIIAAHQRMAVLDGGRRLVEAVVPAAVAFTVVAALPLAVQFLGPQRIQGPVQDLETFSTDFLNLIVPTQYQLVSPDAATAVSDHFSGLFHEATAYVGLPLLLVLTVVVVGLWRDIRMRIAGVMGLVLFVLSLGPVLQIGAASTGWPMPWAPFSQLPLLEHALPGRLSLFTWLAIAAIVTIGIERLIRLRARYATAGLLSLGLALLLVVPAPLRSATTEIPPFFARWDQQGLRDDAVILMAPYFANGAGADPMLWAAAAGDAVRTYEGYVYVPLPDGRPSYGPPSTQLSDAMDAIQDRGDALVVRGEVRQQIARDLANAGITDVIVGPLGNRSQMVGFFVDLFGRQPLDIDGVQLWRDVDRYGVVAPAD